MRNQAPLNSSFSEQVTTIAEVVKILVVDDHEINRKLMRMLLSRLGYSADVACNGLEALSALRQRPYQLILMDIQMPKMDGITATQHIVQRYPGAERPIVIGITAHASPGVRERCLQVGMDDFYTKPIDTKTIASILSKHLTKPRE